MEVAQICLGSGRSFNAKALSPHRHLCDRPTTAMLRGPTGETCFPVVSGFSYWGFALALFSLLVFVQRAGRTPGGLELLHGLIFISPFLHVYRSLCKLYNLTFLKTHFKKLISEHISDLDHFTSSAPLFNFFSALPSTSE
jgi:hypothetical protein